MNKKEIRFAFNEVLSAAESKMCEELHHNKGEYHSSEYICPVIYKLQRQVHIVREYMKENDI